MIDNTIVLYQDGKHVEVRLAQIVAELMARGIRFDVHEDGATYVIALKGY